MERLRQILEIMNAIPFEERTKAVIKARHYILAEYDRRRKEQDESRGDWSSAINATHVILNYCKDRDEKEWDDLLEGVECDED